MKYILSTLIIILFVSCSKDESTGSSSTATASNVLVSALGTFESIGSVASGGTNLILSNNLKGGVPSTYCNANSSPISSLGIQLIGGTDNDYASQRGFFISTHNAQSPDSPLGAIYTAAGISCFAGEDGLFDNLSVGGSNSKALTIDLNGTCWGTEAQRAAFISDNGSSTLSATVTVTKLADAHPYDYTVAITSGMTIYIKSSDNVLAALMDDTVGDSTAWAFHLDQTTGILGYESILAGNNRRARIYVQGTLNASNEFTTLTTFSGFYIQGSNASTLSELVTFTGNTSGILGNYYSSSGNVTEKCYIPGGTGNCSSIRSITGSTTIGESLLSASGTAAANLIQSTSLLSISSIDPSDTDITQ